MRLFYWDKSEGERTAERGLRMRSNKNAAGRERILLKIPEQLSQTTIL